MIASDSLTLPALKATELVFQYPPDSWRSDRLEAREKLHNAAAIAGIAHQCFSGHQLQPGLIQWEVNSAFPTGAQTLFFFLTLLPITPGCPTKFVSYPKYEQPPGAGKIPPREIVAHLRLPAASADEGVQSLIEAIHRLNCSLGDTGPPLLNWEWTGNPFMSKPPLLAEKAFEDQCTTTNPRLPLIRELEEILRQSYDGLKPSSRKKG